MSATATASPSRLLDVHQVAEQLRCSSRSVWNRVHRERSLACIRVGRRLMFMQRDIDDYLARQRVPAQV